MKQIATKTNLKAVSLLRRANSIVDNPYLESALSTYYLRRFYDLVLGPLSFILPFDLIPNIPLLRKKKLMELVLDLLFITTFDKLSYLMAEEGATIAPKKKILVVD